jgi:hypothetical protein
MGVPRLNNELGTAVLLFTSSSCVLPDRRTDSFAIEETPVEDLKTIN